MQRFESGATRDSSDHKSDYEGFLSPLVIKRFGTYMHKNRVQKDGALRDSDNWQKGITLTAYMKSLWRHFHDMWTIHRGFKAYDFENKLVDMEEALCGIMFNTMGYLHEMLKERLKKEKEALGPCEYEPAAEQLERQTEEARESLHIKIH